MTPFKHRETIEFLKWEAIKAEQERLLQQHLAYAESYSPYYRKLFQSHTIQSNKISLDSLHTLPLTDKTCLAEQNGDFLAVPMSKIVDIVLSSGTTGKPTTIMYTEDDLQRLEYNEVISFTSCGLTSDDVVLLTCTIDRCFIAGLAYFSGIRGLGAAAIRNGLNNVESHLEVIQRLKPTAMVGVPTFLLKLGQYVQSQGLDPGSLGIRKMVCIGEPLRGQDLSFLKVGKALEEIWNADVYSTYASSEAITSFCECTSKQGGHLHPDLAVVEIIDDNGEVLPSGKTGEVVLTPLSIEGMPLVRFRTGDISFLIDEPCECGRNSVRLGPILGRRQQMIKFRGTTMYPGTLYAALDSIPQINEYFVVATCGYDLSDFISVHVSVNDSRLTTKEIEDKLQAVLRARPEVHIVSDDIIKKQLYAGNARKVTRFVDKRTNQ